MKEPFEEYIARELEEGTLLIACGLPATNKTETTEVVSRLKGYPILRSDLIRKEVLADEDIFDAKVAGSMEKRTRVYDEMFRQAEEKVLSGPGVILDATFVKKSLRDRAADIAARNRKTFVILRTHCSEEYSLEKISKRTRENYESNALTPDAYYNNVKRFEPPDLDQIKEDHPELSLVQITVNTESDHPEEWYVIADERR